MKVSIEIPENLTEVALERWQRLAQASSRTEAEASPEELISILAGQPISVIRLIPAAEITRAMENVVNTMGDTSHELIEIYQLDDKKRLGCEPRLDEMSLGMMADVSEALESPERWHEAMAILYRPITRETPKFGALYAIEPYDVDDPAFIERAELMKGAPASLFMGVRAFFLRGFMKYELRTEASLIRQPIPAPVKARRKQGRERQG